MSDDVSMGALDGSLGERARGRLGGRLRYRSPLQRVAGGAAGGRRGGAATRGRGAAGARMPRSRAAVRPTTIDLAEAREAFAALLAGGGRLAAARTAVS